MTSPTFTVTILGSGAALPTLDRCSSGYLVRTPQLAALVDCGNGTLRRLLRTDQPYAGLDAIFVTHTHADHVADLVPLVQALILQNPPRSRPLRLFGPPAFLEFVEQRVLPVSSTPATFELEVEEAAASVEVGDVTVRTADTRHSRTMPSLAYRFEVGDRAVVFSGDADLNPGLTSLATGADLLILDCSFPDALKTAGHLSAGECGQLARDAGARTVVLSHIYPTPMPPTLRVHECRQHFTGTTLLAEDLMELEIGA